MPITFGSDFDLAPSQYWVDPTPAAPVYNPVSTFFFATGADESIHVTGGSLAQCADHGGRYGLRLVF